VDAIETTIEKDLAETEAMVRQAPADQGFGVLTDIDVAATLRAKLGVERRALKILGACNPSPVNRALDLDPAVALVLPCNVVLEDLGEGRTSVTIAHRRTMLGAFGGAQHEQLEELGAEDGAVLEKVTSTLGG
jgi:uncharacterized protein (DUF302 family)